MQNENLAKQLILLAKCFCAPTLFLDLAVVLQCLFVKWFLKLLISEAPHQFYSLSRSQGLNGRLMLVSSICDYVQAFQGFPIMQFQFG